MRIRGRLAQTKAVVANAVGLISGHKRASIAAALALLIAGPLLAGAGDGPAGALAPGQGGLPPQPAKAEAPG